jgi:putative transposase
MVDYVHMLTSISPKYTVSSVVGYIKGKSAIHIARTYGELKRNFAAQHFWARGYFILTVGRDDSVLDSPSEERGTTDGSVKHMG